MNARSQQQKRRGSNLSIATAVQLVALLGFPSLACVRLAGSFDPRFIVGYLVVISAVTFWLYWRDKRRAETDGWRIPESTLHIAELLGGWPAAFLAQRAFRHKIAKTSYQVAFWAIVAVHEAASFDFLNEWHFSGTAIRFLIQ